MQCLQKTRLLDFHTDTLEVVRKSYGFDNREDVSKAVDILEDWVKQQRHFTKKDFSRDYLERCIINNKGSMEQTKKKLEKNCTFRTLWPKYFTDFYAREEVKKYGDDVQVVGLPKLTEDHCRVLLLRNALKTFRPTFVTDMFRVTFMGLELLKAEDYVHGYIFILDMSDMNIAKFIKVLNITELRQCFAIFVEGYAARIKGIHIWSDSKLIEVIVKIAKLILSAKIFKRIHVHSKLESIYDFVPKASLPIDYGGEERSMRTLFEEWVDELSSKDFMEYKREMNNARSDESLRQRNRNKVDDNSMGITRTFRTLNLD